MSPLPVKLAQVKADARFKLPGTLPANERILWQGAPTWQALARNALHIRGLAIYLAIIVAWVGISAIRHGAPLGDIAFDTGRAGLVALAPLAIVLAYAWLAARGTAYTITNRRVIIRLGVALPLTLNLPFAQIDAANLSANKDGTGGIALKLMPGTKGLGWLIMWPHARPWRLGVAEPMLRAIVDAPRAGQILASALAASAALGSVAITGASTGAPVAIPQDNLKVDTLECNSVATVAAA